MTNPNLTRDAAAAIDGAIDILTEHGWCRGISRNEAGEHCVMGAVVHARSLSNPDELSYTDIYKVAERAVYRAALTSSDGRISNDCFGAVYWNDRYARDA